MRHRKHNHLLGVKTAHRASLIANLSCSLIENGRIKTTLAKARALRPAIEKAITLAKKAQGSDDTSKKIHYRRLAIARLRSKTAVKKLFDELVDQFVGRNGGYTRIYKLAIPRLGDAADMAIIEFVEAVQKKAKKKRTTKKNKSKVGKPVQTEESSVNKEEDSPAKEVSKSDEESASDKTPPEETVEPTAEKTDSSSKVEVKEENTDAKEEEPESKS